MTGKDKASGKRGKDEPNLGQKDARSQRESDSELRTMGEKSARSSGKSDDDERSEKPRR